MKYREPKERMMDKEDHNDMVMEAIVSKKKKKSKFKLKSKDLIHESKY